MRPFFPAMLLSLFASSLFSPLMNANATPSPTPTSSVKTAMFGGGCFWCIDAVFQNLPGVIKITSGFAGGAKADPTYDQVCSGRTGHAEVIQITYDPAKVSYNQLLDLFWKAHDPTTLNRQGADSGTQYRSIILTATPEEAAEAQASKKKAQAQFDDPIVTEIAPLKTFYPAESYHQNYYQNNKDRNPYCQVVIAPKLKKLGLPQ
ncbi:MAG: peptide-methionine (S)-S-oxide reductase MsrA [Verrucomicrobia bacterium]|nr:peptide-methionine (S)-S-oxide reductase MsrA [Verrucomicrobiota bacterium]